MNNVLNDLKEILRISTVTEYTRLGFTGVFVADEPIKITTILNYTEDNEHVVIEFDEDNLSAPMYEDFELGKSYPFDVTVHITETAHNFFSSLDYLLNYVLSSFERIEWDKKIILPFDTEISPQDSQYKQYFIYMNELMCLYANNAYLDGNKRFVLFTEKPLVIHPNAEIGFDVSYRKVFDKVDIDIFARSIHSLKVSIEDEPIESHKKEKQAILVMETSSILKSYDPEERFYRLIEKIEKISNSVANSFQAYLNNFSYQKLELELKKDLDYFVKSINDSLGTLQTQALGLPVAAALIQLNKVNLTISYVALMVFSGFVVFNAFQQSKQVEYIIASIKRFFEKDDVKPVVDKDINLQKMNEILGTRVEWIVLYIKMIASVAILTFIYALLYFLESLDFCCTSFLFKYILLLLGIYGAALKVKHDFNKIE